MTPCPHILLALALAVPIARAQQPDSPGTPVPASQAPDSATQWLRSLWADASAAATDVAAQAQRVADTAWQTVRGSDAPIVEPRTRVMVAPAAGAEQKPEDIRWEALDTAWPVGSTVPTRVIVLVHGLDEYGAIWDELAPTLAKHSYAVMRFDYPNDQHIPECADQLAAALAALRARGVEHIDIVAHSMGGLVSRDVLTRSDYYAGDATTPESASLGPLPRVDRLIMLGTPNQGAPVAWLQPLSEAREHIIRAFSGNGLDGAGWLSSAGDGSGEAAIDLTPDSDFLRDLNARIPTNLAADSKAAPGIPRNVAITNVVGVIKLVAETDAPVAPTAPNPAPSTAEPSPAPTGGSAFTDPAKIDAAIRAWLETAADSLGDGLVPKSSALYPGIDDTVIIEADHRQMINRFDIRNTMTREWRKLNGTGEAATTPDPAPAIPIILDRLARPMTR